MKRWLPVMLACVAAPTIFAQAPQAPQTPVFRAMVDLVRVDVQAVNDTGHPVVNLTADDFQVFIDGRPRRVVTMELVRYATAATTTVGADRMMAPIRTPGRIPEDGRLYVVAVDQSAFRTGALGQVRQALQQFINQLRVEDMVGLYDFPFRQPILDLTHDHSAVVTAFNRLTGLMDPAMGTFNLSPSEIVDITAGDVDVHNRVVSRECDAADPSCPMAVKGEASAIAGYMEADAQMRLASLRNLMGGLARIPGRKTVVLVSGGMMSSTRVGGRPDVMTVMGQVGSAAASADANLYVLHYDNLFMDVYSASSRTTSRPQDRFESLFADRHAMGQGLEVIAGKAGGALLRVEAGTGETAFNRVLRETSAYYLLGVQPEEIDRDGKAHFLRVSVKPRGVTVRVRSQFIVPRRVPTTGS